MEVRIEEREKRDGAPFTHVVHVTLSTQNLKHLLENSGSREGYISRLDGEVLLSVLAQDDDTHYAKRPWAKFAQ